MSDENNPYALSPDKVAEPPTTILGSLKYIGPGFIISASIVGSGELIATTVSGAKAGFWLLWLIIIGCVIKVFTQVEIGRYTVTHSETALQALDPMPLPGGIPLRIRICTPRCTSR